MARSQTQTSRNRNELQRLQAENVALRAHFSAWRDLSLRLTSSLDLPTVLQEVVDAACALSGARYGALGIFDSSGHIQQFLTHGVTAEKRKRIGDLPEGRGLLGWLQESQQPLRLADLTSHSTSVGFPPNHPPMKTFLGAPIRLGEEKLGNLYLTEKLNGEEFTPEDEALLLLFSSQAALAIHNARLHQAVEAERGRMEATLQNSPDGMILVDARSGTARSNLRAEMMLGRTIDPLNGAAVLADSIRDPSGKPLPDAELPISRALGGEFIAGEEMLLVRQDGSQLPILCSAAPVRDVQGKVQGAVVQFQNMTSVLEAQRTLAESEAQHRAVLDNSTAVIYIKDLEGRYVLVNRRYESLFHVSQEEIKGKTDFEVFTREQAESFRANDLKVIESCQPLETEEIAPHDDGPHTYISLKVPLVDRDGAVYAVCGISTDITERKQAEDAVERERQRLEALVNTSPHGVIVADLQSERVVLRNREAIRIFGSGGNSPSTLKEFEESAVRRRPDGSVYTLEELPLYRALHLGENVRAEEIRYEFPNGYSVPTLVNSAPVHTAGGHITGAIATIQDITPLEEVEKLRSEFLGIVSHELRTPLTAIKGSAATVLGSRRPLDDVETREFFQIIDEQADRLSGLIDNLLDMTRIEAGSLSVTAQPADLATLLEEVRDTFARGGGIQEVQLQIPQDLPAVQADRRRVGQVMANLLGNAAKFSPTVAPITVEVEHDPLQVTVHVRDQGRGIPPDQLHHLFKKFSQVHRESGSQLSGSGLGLAICKGIVEAHGGRIWAESDGEGKGATFSFTLPLASAVPETVPLDTSRRDQHLGRVHRGGERTRILAVDDEVRILRYLERTLEEAGYHALVTSDPSRITDMVEVEEPDLVLLDLMFPGVNGFELLQRIREFSGVPVIFLSARDRDEDAVQALRMGADDYITKPFSPSELLARIEAALRRRLLPDQVEARPPFELGDLSINFAERKVTVGSRVINPSATEYKVLYELATHAGLVLTHDQILQRVWGPEYSGETALVRSFIRNLRRKLGDDARNPRYILTEPQVGYRMPRP